MHIDYILNHKVGIDPWAAHTADMDSADTMDAVPAHTRGSADPIGHILAVVSIEKPGGHFVAVDVERAMDLVVVEGGTASAVVGPGSENDHGTESFRYWSLGGPGAALQRRVPHF